MKSSKRSLLNLLLILGLPGGAASGQIFVTLNSSGKVAEYAVSGALMNDSLISGLNQPSNLTLDGAGNLYVTSGGNNTVGKYTTSGQTVNAALFSTASSAFYSMTGIAVDGNGNIFVAQSMGNANIAEYSASGARIQDPLINLVSSSPQGLALDGSGNLYVATSSRNAVGKYTTGGTTVNAGFIAINSPSSVALDGNGHIFVGTFSGTVGEYNLDGSPVNASLITGLHMVSGLALDGNEHLFVAEPLNSSVAEYTTSGQVVSASLISGINQPWGIAVVVPEPSPVVLAFTALILFGLCRGQKRHRASVHKAE